MKFGKLAYEHSDLTLQLGKFIKPEVRVPDNFDFDKTRKAFPFREWGNDHYEDCVIAARADHLIRLERTTQRQTIPIFDLDVVTLYKEMTGCEKPGDKKDTGLVVLQAMRQWRNEGWKLPELRGVRNEHNYKIWAFGELDPHKREELRAGIYTLHGIHMGFWLPKAAKKMEGCWDYNGESGPEWQPGTWSGQLVYAKAFDADFIEVITWGKKIRVSNNFIEKYCDEAWGIVDSNESWRVMQTLDMGALANALFAISRR